MKITDLPVPESVKEIIIRSGIGELYPPQEEAIKAGALEGRNLVLASPTASGKTLVAEFCALKHILEKNGKTIYLTPLRALASEKFEEFKKYASIRKANGKRVRIGISTGDYDSVTGDMKILVQQYGLLELTTVGQLVDRKMADCKPHILPDGKEVCVLHDDGIKVFAINDHGKVVLAPVKAVIRHKTYKTVYEVETRTGRKIKVTGDHCLFTLDENRIIKPIRVDDLRENQSYIAVPRLLPYFKKSLDHIDLLDYLEEFQDCWITGSPIKDVLSSPIIWKVVYKKYKNENRNIYYWKRKGLLPIRVLIELLQDRVINLKAFRGKDLCIVKSHAKIPLVIPFDDYFMTFIGLWLADGSYYHAGVSVSSGPDVNCRRIVDAIAKRFSIKVTETDDGVTFILGSRFLKRIMLRIIGLEGNAYTKRVPSWIFSLSDGQIADLLKGYFSGDGSATKGEVTAYSYSSNLLQDVQTLLLRLGIISRIRKITLRIPRKWSVIFGKKVKFLQEYQNNNARSTSKMSYYDVMPLNRDFAKKAGFRWAYYVGQANIVRNTVRRLLQKRPPTKEVQNTLKKLMNSHILWDKITKIERLDNAETYVYDLSVPPYENFVCENIVAKNSSDPWLERYDIIVSTNEKADSLLRHRAKWMDEISLIVADEVHLLNDAERGPTLEVVLARLMQINPDMQILALSATINNVEEIAEWLKAGYVTTEWRPILLKEGVLLHEEIQYKDGDARKVEKKAKNSALNMALSTVKTGGQALIFATTRRNAVTLAKKTAPEVEGLLSKPVKRALEHDANKILTTGERTRISELLAELVKHGTAFHHAGLGGGHRRIIEDSFRQGKIKVLTATPTLAFGVNLPARTVVIQDYRRYEPGYGYYPISVLEYKQMAGRAGRPKYDKVGEAILLARTTDEADYLMESYILAHPERIWSRLAVERILRSHVLATIAADFAHTERGIYDFFGRTFYAYQYEIRAIRGIIAKILKYLYDE
ncbi:MAG: DEAD/DEAH box helicase, partial [Candidatus Bathyarchaeota archaeon]|nr:DEAD/DEAH box helicase [Candidatus Bathyarchaeota archaeon]